MPTLFVSLDKHLVTILIIFLISKEHPKIYNLLLIHLFFYAFQLQFCNCASQSMDHIASSNIPTEPSTIPSATHTAPISFRTSNMIFRIIFKK